MVMWLPDGLTLGRTAKRVKRAKNNKISATLLLSDQKINHGWTGITDGKLYGNKRGNLSSKLQHPSSREIPSTKLQTKAPLGQPGSAEIKQRTLVLERGCGPRSRALAQVQAYASRNHPTSPLEKVTNLNQDLTGTFRA
jgi:hypothetical protein